MGGFYQVLFPVSYFPQIITYHIHFTLMLQSVMKLVPLGRRGSGREVFFFFSFCKGGGGADGLSSEWF